MMSSRRQACVAFFLAVCCSFLQPMRADEITLLEGKVISGKIISENDQEITIQSGKSMVLTIAKSKIKKINRPDSDKPKTRIVTMEDMKEKPKTAKETPATSPAEKKMTVFNPVEGSKYRNSTNHDVTINEWVVTRVYHVKGSTPIELGKDIYDLENGKGFLSDMNRSASRTKFDVSWSGEVGKEGDQAKWKSVLILSTATVHLPVWDHPAKVSSDTARQWETLCKAIQAHTDGEMKIYANSIFSFGEALMSLRRASEGDLREEAKILFQQALDRAAKQKAGFNRTRQVDWEKILGLKN